eukprot:709275-Lingulodinium_polyedra.AAC.1
MELAKALRKLVRARPHPRAAHAAFALLQRVVCPALDWDLRASPLGAVAAQQRAVHDAVLETLNVIIGGENIEDEEMVLAGLPADLGGLALRSPGRPSAGLAARWAALAEAIPRAQAVARQLGIAADWQQAQRELSEAAVQLEAHGVAC